MDRNREVLDYLIDPDIREPYPWPILYICTKCGNDFLDHGEEYIHCYKCGTYWFYESELNDE
jgi:hypothetical protein